MRAEDLANELRGYLKVCNRLEVPFGGGVMSVIDANALLLYLDERAPGALERGSDAACCADMGCKHPRESHETWGRCTEKRAYYNDRLHGYEQPVIYRTCDCREWKSDTYLRPRPVRDEPQA